MSINQTVVFLFLLSLAISASLTQQQVEAFIAERQLVPPGATLQAYSEEAGRSFATYSDQFSTYKLAIAQDQQGNPTLTFRQQVTQIQFGNNNVVSPASGHIVGGPTVFMQPMIRMQIGPTPQLNSPSIFNPNRHRYPKQNKNMPCRINETEIKLLVKESLSIFPKAEITKVQKVGFQPGTGILLEITLADGGKFYKVQAGYMPRWKRLHILKVQQMEASSQSAKAESGDQLIGNAINEQPKFQASAPEKHISFQNILQSFVEKLLVRKDTRLESKPEVQRSNQPVLLGSEGEPERPIQLTNENKQEQLVMNDREDTSPFKFEEKTENVQKKAAGGHHLEQNSEEISQLVTEVLSKLKLKTK